MPKKTAHRRPQAAALRYDRQKDQAPRLVAKGEGLLAERIKELARQYQIPIREDDDLMELLAALDLQQEIPPSAYLVVAEILAFIYRANEAFQPEP